MDTPMETLEAIVTAVGWLAAAVLVMGGLTKLPRPDGAMATLHRLRLPSGRVAARVLGLGEITVGVGVIAVGGRLGAVVLAVVYAVFAVVAGWQRAAQLDCGCFGTAATAVSAAHVTMNGLFAIAGIAGLVVPLLTVGDVAADARALGVSAGLLLLVTATGLLRLWLERAADAAAASTGASVVVR